MYISQETPEQISKRLRQVIREAELRVYEGVYAFVEVNASDFPQHLVSESLAFVRDEDVWSALVPSKAPDHEKFTLFSFHFKPGFDNSASSAGLLPISSKSLELASWWSVARTQIVAEYLTIGEHQKLLLTQSSRSYAIFVASRTAIGNFAEGMNGGFGVRHRRVGADRDVFAAATCYAGATGGERPEAAAQWGKNFEGLRHS